MRIRRLAASLLLFANACDRASEKPASVEDAWIRLAPVTGRPAAGYFTARTTNAPEAIVAVAGPPPTRIEMHETMSAGSMSSMRPLPSASFGEGRSLTFEPGGKHLMLFALDPSIKAGDTLRLTFRFAKAPPVTVDAEVRAAGNAAPGR